MRNNTVPLSVSAGALVVLAVGDAPLWLWAISLLLAAYSAAIAFRPVT